MWWIWLIIALVAIVAEVAGSGLVFIGVAAAAMVSAVVAVFLDALVVQAVVFVLASTAYVVLLRPTVLRLISGQPTGLPGPQASTHHLVGKRGMVTRTVTPDGGQIRIGNGEFWSARCYSGEESIPEGTRVEVMLVDGLTALVAPMPGSPAQLSDAHSSL